MTAGGRSMSVPRDHDRRMERPSGEPAVVTRTVQAW